MKFSYIYDHHNACAEWQRRDLQEWLTDIFEAPHVPICNGATGAIREHVRSELVSEGWATNVRIDQRLGLTISAMCGDLGFQLQTGNMSRAPYDLLKLQYLYQADRIRAAALAMPTFDCAQQLGSNIANAERISSELEVFKHIITVPILILAFT